MKCFSLTATVGSWVAVAFAATSMAIVVFLPYRNRPTRILLVF